MFRSEIASTFSPVRCLAVVAALALPALFASGAAAAPPRLVAAGSAWPAPTLADGDVFRYATRAVTTGLGGAPYSRTSTDVDTVTYPLLYGTKPAYRLTDRVTDTSDSYASVAQVFFRFVPDAASTDLVELGWDFAQTSLQGTEADRKAYGLPFLRRFSYPEHAMTWPNVVPAIVKQSQIFPNGTSITAFYGTAADGSYHGARKVFSNGNLSTDRYLVNGDASGVLDITGSAVYDFGKPVKVKSSLMIPVTVDGSTYDVPDWFPQATGAAALTALSQTGETVATIGPAPGICGVRAGTWAFGVAEETARLDPVQGSFTTSTTTYYDSPALGLICLVADSKQQSYDNISTGDLLQTVETKTVSILTSETLAGTHVRVAAIPRNLLLSAPGQIDGLHHLILRRL
jgi:hypothetical protein